MGNSLVLNPVSILSRFAFLGCIQRFKFVRRLVRQRAVGPLGVVEINVMVNAFSELVL